MIFLKSILGGVIAVIAVWIVVIFIANWRWQASARERGLTGLVAVAGGSNYLLQLPLVVVLLSAAFGIGLFVTARTAAHRKVREMRQLPASHQTRP